MSQTDRSVIDFEDNEIHVEQLAVYYRLYETPSIEFASVNIT